MYHPDNEWSLPVDSHDLLLDTPLSLSGQDDRSKLQNNTHTFNRTYGLTTPANSRGSHHAPSSLAPSEMHTKPQMFQAISSAHLQSSASYAQYHQLHTGYPSGGSQVSLDLGCGPMLESSPFGANMMDGSYPMMPEPQSRLSHQIPHDVTQYTNQ